MESKTKYHTSEEVSEPLVKDCEIEVCIQDSSSDDEELIHADEDMHSDDLEHELLLLPEGVNDEDHQPSRSPTPSSQPESDDDYEPPQQIKPKRKAKQGKDTAKIMRRVSPDKAEMWHSKDEEDKNPNTMRFTPARDPGPTFDRTAAWSPLSLFQLFFSTSVVRTLITNTNANAAKKKEAGQKFKWTTLTESDFYIFLAIIVFTGLVGVRHISDYWKKDWPYNFHFPRKSMSRNRFEAILWSLHLSNPTDDVENDKKKGTPEYDQLFKIKPLYDQIVTACKANFQPHKNICVDERMVGSRAKNGMIKQYMKDKSRKWGFKLIVLFDSSTGYMWNFFVYTEKRESSDKSSSLVDLLPFSLLGGGYNLYVDGCYISPAFIRHLYKNRIGCCGVIKKNQANFPHTDQNDFPEEVGRRGDMRWMRKDDLLFVKWVDTQEVMMCSTVHKAFSGKTVQRSVKQAGRWKTLAVPAPDAVLDYYKNMSGGDFSDALVEYYSVHHKTMKWYKTFFYYFIDLAIANSFVLYKQLRKSQAGAAYTQKTFREQLLAEMMEFAGSPLQSPAPTPTLTCMPCYYGSDATKVRKYCRMCQEAGIQRVKTPIYCTSCNVPLCFTPRKNCFEEWHVKKESKL